MFVSKETLAKNEKKKIVKRRLLAHREHPNIFYCRTNILAMFQGIFKIFCFIYKL
jgi:hypothetical protein